MAKQVAEGGEGSFTFCRKNRSPYTKYHHTPGLSKTGDRITPLRVHYRGVLENAAPGVRHSACHSQKSQPIRNEKQARAKTFTEAEIKFLKQYELPAFFSVFNNHQ